MMAKCSHAGDWNANVEVNKLLDIGRYAINVRCECSECGMPLRFLGLPVGLDLMAATVSYDATEVRLSATPKDQPPPSLKDGIRGFGIRRQETDEGDGH